MTSHDTSLKMKTEAEIADATTFIRDRHKQALRDWIAKGRPAGAFYEAEKRESERTVKEFRKELRDGMWD